MSTNLFNAIALGFLGACAFFTLFACSLLSSILKEIRRIRWNQEQGRGDKES